MAERSIEVTSSTIDGVVSRVFLKKVADGDRGGSVEGAEGISKPRMRIMPGSEEPAVALGIPEERSP